MYRLLVLLQVQMLDLTTVIVILRTRHQVSCGVGGCDVAVTSGNNSSVIARCAGLSCLQIFSTYVSWIRYAGIASDKKRHGVTTLPAFFKLKNHFAL